MVMRIILDLPNEEALKLLDEDIKALGITDEDIKALGITDEDILTESKKNGLTRKKNEIFIRKRDSDALEYLRAQRPQLLRGRSRPRRFSDG